MDSLEESLNKREDAREEAKTAGLDRWTKGLDGLTYEIATLWDGRPLQNQAKVRLKMTPSVGYFGINLEVVAPFYHDPSPPGRARKPQPGLWDYEVVEAFFLGLDNKYLEVELCPHGQHLVLQLDGVRNIIKEGLPLQFKATIDEDSSSWKGLATIPHKYLPPGLKSFNAYAIHGEGEGREYQALFPAKRGKHQQPDFHRLEYFQEIPWDQHILYSMPFEPPPASIWK